MGNAKCPLSESGFTGLEDSQDYRIFLIQGSPTWNNRVEVLGFAGILECLSILKLRNFLREIQLVFMPARPNLRAKFRVLCG